MKEPDYKGSIEWAHKELDTWGAPREKDGLPLTVSGRIAQMCAEWETNKQQIQKRLQLAETVCNAITPHGLGSMSIDANIWWKWSAWRNSQATPPEQEGRTE